MDKKNNITDSKNTISGSSISAGNNVHIGDIINIHQKQEQSTSTKKMPSEVAEKIRNLIARNRIKQTLEELLKHSKNMDEDLHAQVIQQSQRWNDLKKNEMLGIISMTEAGTIRNRIVYGLLGIVGELEEL